MRPATTQPKFLRTTKMSLSTGGKDFEETVLSFLKGLWYGATKEEYDKFMTPEDFDSYYDVFKSINSKRYKSEVSMENGFSKAFGDWDTY